eukprot:scaffold3823_cov195-Amphora_coffeaeformis.AAC.19
MSNSPVRAMALPASNNGPAAGLREANNCVVVPGRSKCGNTCSVCRCLAGAVRRGAVEKDNLVVVEH